MIGLEDMGALLLATAPLLAALAAGVSASAADDEAQGLPAGVRIAQSSITLRSMIVRVPVPRATAVPAPQRWRERRGPKCVPLAGIAGAQIVEEESVDLILRGGRRVRAELDRACPALDYYSGFYLRPTADGQVCADRDTVHARSGGACQIERFRLLVPRR